MAEADAIPPTDNSDINPETLKKAYKAFKKRLKLTRLDEDSRLGHGPLSSGSSGVTSIIPPDTYPPEVWEALVRQGKLRNTGHGFYEIAPRP